LAGIPEGLAGRESSAGSEGGAAMSSPIDHGGLAFPSSDGYGHVFPGLTRRDHFAGQALAGILAASGDGGGFSHFDIKEVANRSWKMADAMIAARREAQP
jgi:hypothetical protein